MLKAIFFDLDGTLLPLKEDLFIQIYVEGILKKFIPHGFDKDKLLYFSKKNIVDMFNNDGSRTNEQIYFDDYKEIFGEYTEKDQMLIDEFYKVEFEETFKACDYNPYARKIVEYCKEKGLKVILSTNPVFPKIATTKRMAMTGLKEEDFDYITTYDNSRFCKPNPNYFLELLEKFDLNKDEVIVFGNNTHEDGECANKAGLKCFIIGDYVIDNKNILNNFTYLKMDEVIKTIEENLKSS